MELANGTSSVYVRIRELFQRTGGKTDDGFPSYIHQYLSALQRKEWVIINKCIVRHLVDDTWSVTINSHSKTYRETRRYSNIDHVYKVIVERRHYNEKTSGGN